MGANTRTPQHSHRTPGYTEQLIRVPDGLLIYARDYAPPHGHSGRTLVCLHGLTRNSADFDDFARAMVTQGHRVLALDMRGRGRSDNDPEWRRYRPQTYAADVSFCLEVLQTGPSIFVGTSMGGIITLVVAATAPRLVSAAVLNDVGPVLNPAGIARIIGGVGNIGPFASWAALEQVVRRTQGALFPGKTDAFWSDFACRVGRQRNDGQVEFAYDPAIARVLVEPSDTPALDLCALFSELARVPVLVVRGANSDILTAEGVAAMRCLKPDLAVVEVPGIGHAPSLSEPEALPVIESFLNCCE